MATINPHRTKANVSCITSATSCAGSLLPDLVKRNRGRASSVALIICVSIPLWLCDIGANDEGNKTLTRAERLAWLHNWNKARPLYDAAERQFITAGDVRKAALSRIGLILSRIYTTDSLNLLMLLDQQLNSAVVQQDLNLKLRCLAAKAYLEEQPDLLLARESWTEVLALAQQLKDKNWEIRALGHLGIFSWVIDIDSVAATRQVGQALVGAIGSNDLSAQVWFQKDIGNVLCLMRRFEAAMNFFQKALTSASLDKDGPFPTGVYIGKARGLIQMGRAKEAMGLVDRVLQEANETGDHNAVAEALILRARGLLTGNFGEAISSLNRAISLAKDGRFQRTLSDALEEMATLYQATGSLEQAQEYQTQCIDATRARHDGYSLPQRFSRLAEIHVKRGYISEANALYDQVTDIVEALLVNSPSPYAKASLIDWLSDIFTNHFKLAVNQLNDPEQARTILERARGRTLAEAIRSNLIDPAHGSSNALAPNKELSFLNSRLLEAKTAAERKDLLDQLFVAEQRMAPGIAQRNNYFRHVVSRPASLRSVQSALRSDEALLEFLVSEPQSYCLQITQKELITHKLPGRSALDTLIDEYLYRVRRKEMATDISRKLFADLLGGVSGLDRYALLTIVPDQNLHLLPFESLIGPNERPLLESHSVGYVQSATVLHLLRTLNQERERVDGTLLAVGDASYTRPRSVTQRGLLSIEGAELDPLPFSKKEVLAIAEIFPRNSVVLTGPAATEDNLKSRYPLDHYALLHFAVHGYANDQFPERSALVLSRSRNSPEDGLLQDREIINLRLPASLVTLSACDSGYGKLHGQEGLSSLVKAFMLAGARTVVASIWNADDMMTARLMKEFYFRLSGGETKAGALRNAKLSILKREASLSPYFWAGFTLWGDGISTIGQLN